MNLNLVIDTSQFKPFDYRMAWEAIDKYNAGYEKQLAVYDKIALTLGDLASAVEGSTKAKLIYDSYQQLFNNAASDFANGMNMRNARELANLRKMYGTQIRQLEKANEAMVKEAERRRTAKPEMNMMYLNIGTLDDWMENPNRTLGSYSGTLLSSEVSSMMKAAANDMIRLDNAGRLDPYVKTWLKTKGFSSLNVNKAIAEVQEGGISNVKDNIMRGILQSAMLSSGIYNWADEDTKRKAEIMASRGLYGGIGQSEMNTYEDKAASKALDYYYDELKADNAFKRLISLEALKLQKDLNAAIGGIVPRSYLNESAGLGKTKYLKLKENLESLIGKDGNLKKEYLSINIQQTNPIKIYDEYIKYANEHKTTRTLSSTSPGWSKNNTIEVPDYATAEKHIKEKYGVQLIITKDLYDALKAVDYRLGVENKTPNKLVNYSMLDYGDRLNDLATRNTISYLNGENINKAIGNALIKGISNSGSNLWVHYLNDDLTSGDPVAWDKVLGLLGEIDKNENVLETGIDIGREKIIMVLRNGEKLELDPKVFGDDFERDWNTMLNNGIGEGKTKIPGKKEIENSNYTKLQKAQALYQLLKAITLNLGLLVGRNFFKTASLTTNQ